MKLAPALLLLCLTLTGCHGAPTPAPAPTIPVSVAATPTVKPVVVTVAPVVGIPTPIMPPAPVVPQGQQVPAIQSATAQEPYTRADEDYANQLTKALRVMGTMPKHCESINDVTEMQAVTEQAQSMMAGASPTPRFVKADSLFRSAMQKMIEGCRLGRIGFDAKDKDTLNDAIQRISDSRDLANRAADEFERVGKELIAAGH